VHIVHNWNWDPVSVTAPLPLADVLAGTSIAANTSVQLGPWDVRVFVSDEER
jgi:beta-galactosidase